MKSIERKLYILNICESFDIINDNFKKQNIVRHVFNENNDRQQVCKPFF